MKYVNEEIEENEGTINGIDGFCENPRYENCYIYYGMMPTVNVGSLQKTTKLRFTM